MKPAVSNSAAAGAIRRCADAMRPFAHSQTYLYQKSAMPASMAKRGHRSLPAGPAGGTRGSGGRRRWCWVWRPRGTWRLRRSGRFRSARLTPGAGGDEDQPAPLTQSLSTCSGGFCSPHAVGPGSGARRSARLGTVAMPPGPRSRRWRIPLASAGRQGVQVGV